MSFSRIFRDGREGIDFSYLDYGDEGRKSISFCAFAELLGVVPLCVRFVASWSWFMIMVMAKEELGAPIHYFHE